MAKPLDPDSCTRADMARVCGVQLTTIDSWRRSGCPHRTSGRSVLFQIDQVYKWRLDREMETLPNVQETDAEGYDLMQEQARLNAFKADAQEMTNAERRGELIEVSKVEETWTSVVMAIRSGVMALGSRLAPEIVGLKTERQIKRRIDQEGNVVLSALSEGGK